MDPWYLKVVERDVVPDAVLSAAIRARIARRVAREGGGSEEERSERFRQLVQRLRDAPIAVATDAANEQHYEVPAEFFELILGPRRKYSSAYWPPGVDELADAEDAMLELYVDRAGLADGQRVLELGCGWGSLCLWLAQRFPGSSVVGVSNSQGQRRSIEVAAAQRGLTNLEVVTADVNEFAPDGRFDRIVSIEMFEHMKNYRQLLARIADWLVDDGTLFVHVFSHRTLAFEFRDDDPSDWIGRYFFTGGLMPSDDLLAHFQDDLVLTDHWRLDGTHYERTLRAWLALLDARRPEVEAVLADTYGADEATRWLVRWRLFLLVSAELWGWHDGHEFCVSHYRFARR
ncbi:MAG TPA: cyclopropane-fatty-acyl-phospholipid synthase family protein [Acidimicrobiales bacterium]